MADYKSSTLDAMALVKTMKTGGNLVRLDDQGVWTNAEVLQRRIVQQKGRTASRSSRGLMPTQAIAWGGLFKKSTAEQLDGGEVG